MAAGGPDSRAARKPHGSLRLDDQLCFCPLRGVASGHAALPTAPRRTRPHRLL